MGCMLSIFKTTSNVDADDVSKHLTVLTIDPDDKRPVIHHPTKTHELQFIEIEKNKKRNGGRYSLDMGKSPITNSPQGVQIELEYYRVRRGSLNLGRRDGSQRTISNVIEPTIDKKSRFDIITESQNQLAC